MINIVLPIAGRGSRFVEAGFVLPKPLIPVHGKPMIEIVVKNIKPKEPHRFIFVALKDKLVKSTNALLNANGFSSRLEISLNCMPGIGKSGTVLIACFRS